MHTYRWASMIERLLQPSIIARTPWPRDQLGALNASLFNIQSEASVSQAEIARLFSRSTGALYCELKRNGGLGG